MLWSFWRSTLWVPDWSNLAGMGDVLDCGVLWMDVAWSRNTMQAYSALLAVEIVTGVACLGGVPNTSNSTRYRKVASLVAHTSSQAEPGSVPDFLHTVETFAALSVGQWLKVAGGEKAEVIEEGYKLSCPGVGGHVAMELGAFVGYTAARLCGMGETAVVTFEQDPIHVAVARWHLNHAFLLSRAEVVPGRVVDALPWSSEAVGAQAVFLAFLDEGGSSFSSDHAQLERLGVFSSRGVTIADNCVRPGAPNFVARVFSFNGGQRAVGWETAAWQLPEFLEERFGIEDWMVVLVRF